MKKNIVITLLILFGCKSDNVNNENHYFDLKSFFSIEADLHNSLHDKAEKILTKGNKTEPKIFSINNWLDELTPFTDADINKPAWKNSFTCDSITTGNKVQISYLCTDKSVPVKKVLIEKTEQHISKIEIETAKDNIFYDAKSSLEYVPAQGYKVKNWQKSFLSEPDEFELIVKFTK